MSYIFSFSSRNGALKFHDALGANGLASTLVNTPLNGNGCGLSVKCDDYASCRGVLMRGRYQGFLAAYGFDGEKYTAIFDPN